MKKTFLLIVIGLFSIVCFSFTFPDKPQTADFSLLESKFKHYHIHVQDTWIAGGCTFTFGLWVDFDWAGPGHPPTNIGFSNGSIDVNCPHHTPHTVNARSYSFDSDTGYITSLSFDTTGDTDYDNVLSDSSFINQTMDDINSQII